MLVKSYDYDQVWGNPHSRQLLVGFIPQVRESATFWAIVLLLPCSLFHNVMEGGTKWRTLKPLNVQSVRRTSEFWMWSLWKSCSIVSEVIEWLQRVLCKFCPSFVRSKKRQKKLWCRCYWNKNLVKSLCFIIVKSRFIFMFNTKRPISSFFFESIAKSLKVWVKCDYFEALHIEMHVHTSTWTLLRAVSKCPSFSQVSYRDKGQVSINLKDRLGFVQSSKQVWN